ncbi:MAG: SH3 domain-containing protein [Bacillota bacterium]|nr:SH3 domain-containing protein [Bacillota bacterium]
MYEKVKVSNIKNSNSNFRPITEIPNLLEILNESISFNTFSISELSESFGEMQQLNKINISELSESFSNLQGILTYNSHLSKAIENIKESMIVNSSIVLLSEMAKELQMTHKHFSIMNMSLAQLASKNISLDYEKILKNQSFVVSELFKNLSFEPSGISKLGTVYSELLKKEEMIGKSNLLSNSIDSLKLEKAIAKSFDNISLKSEVNFESLVLDVTDNYIADCNSELKNKDNDAEGIGEKFNFWMEIISSKSDLIQTIVAVVTLIFTIFSAFSSKQEIPSTTVNNVQYVNNIYIQNGYDADFLNETGLRIVNTDIVLREKPDCTSKVTGKLTSGDIVTIVGKYRKWVNVSWIDENEEFHSGWIQNYHLTEFVKPKKVKLKK